MHGLITKTLVDLVESVGGPEAVADVARAAGLPHRALRIDDYFPDETFRAVVGAACERLDITVEQAESAYAKHFFADSLRRWPTWFRMSGTSKDFLARVPTIHNILAQGLHTAAARSAHRDKFVVEAVGERDLVTSYRSDNQHCGLYKKLARLVIDHYGDEAEIDEPRCMKRGDETCVLHVEWSRLGGAT